MFVRRAVFAAFALALLVPAMAAPAKRMPAKGPTGLKAFLLNYNETGKRTFSRTPLFAWKPVARARNYEFQLATGSNFRENSILWSSETLKLPVASIPLALPWATGKPYAYFVRVRARTQRGMTRWSKDFGFNVRWPRVPAQLSAPNGLLRWTPIDGATAYEVLESSTSDPSTGFAVKVHSVASNVTDMRDWLTFHSNPYWAENVYWRVRAVRVSYYPTAGFTSFNGQTSTSYGPWSPLYHTPVTLPAGPIVAEATASDVLGTSASPVAHVLMPGLGWRGSTPFSDLGFLTHLYRPYIFSDKDCTQPVFTGSIVGSPAWVPRLTGALVLPRDADTLAEAIAGFMPDGNQGAAAGYDIHPIVANESGAAASSSSSSTANQAPATLDLWDRSWPSSPYYWTVVAVRAVWNTEGSIDYYDMELPQDVCAAGRVVTFGKISKPVPTAGTKSFVIGLSVAGRTKSAAARKSPRIYGTPIVSWTPVPGAHAYEVQVSRSHYPFRPKAKVGTYATSLDLSMLLDATSGGAFALQSGTWYYRVRGLDAAMPPGAQGMAWSSIRKLSIAKPVFRVG